MSVIKDFFKKYNGVRTTGPDCINLLTTMRTEQLIRFRDIYAKMEVEAIYGIIEKSLERSQAFVQICAELKRRNQKEAP